MEAALCAEAEKAHGAIAKAQGSVPKSSVTTGRSSNTLDQSNSTWLGELLCDWAFE